MAKKVCNETSKTGRYILSWPSSVFCYILKGLPTMAKHLLVLIFFKSWPLKPHSGGFGNILVQLSFWIFWTTILNRPLESLVTGTIIVSLSEIIPRYKNSDFLKHGRRPVWVGVTNTWSDTTTTTNNNNNVNSDNSDDSNNDDKVKSDNNKREGQIADCTYLGRKE
jgi:hypothetical protein